MPKKDWTVRECEARRKPGTPRVSRQLYLNVEETGSKQWLFRYYRGKDTWIGLGSFDLVSLAEARDLVIDCRRLVRDSKDPRDHPSLVARRRTRRKPEAAPAAVTFESEAEEYVKTQATEHAAPHWRQWLRDYINPVIGRLHPKDVTRDHVLKILTEPGETPAGKAFGPLWTTKHVAAERARYIIEKVLGACEDKDLRDGKNPASLQHLASGLPKHKHVVKHVKSLNWRKMPQFVVKLHKEYEKEQGRSKHPKMAGVMPLLLEWSFLINVRPSEARLSTHEEITVDKETGIEVLKIPIERMKIKVPVDDKDPFHTVPLTPRMIEIREEMARRFGPTGYIFKGIYPGKPVSRSSLRKLLVRMGVKHEVDPHGFRSTMRSWGSAQNPRIDPEVLELILAHHVVGNEVQRAYDREQLLIKRKNAHELYERYCLSGLDQDAESADTALDEAAD